VKAPAKASLIAVAAAIATLLVAWIATFFYWDFRIRGAIREFGARPPGPLQTFEHDEAWSTIQDAGCRGLPYLVSGLQNPPTQDALTYQLQSMLEWMAESCGPRHREGFGAAAELVERAAARPGDSPEERRRKAALILEWWTSRGRSYHQWWRVWSPACATE
jgi:hypothetical protein